MSDLDPSYLLKLDWAQKHLDHLNAEIEAFSSSHPYTVAKRREGKTEVWRLTFTPALSTDVSLIGADFVHNVRSALDHLTAALVPASRRDKTYFPIFWEGVWDPPEEGDDAQALIDRSRWETIVKKMKPEAVAVLQGLQPYRGYTPQSEKTHLLSSLNRLWNADKHTRLPYVATGLSHATITFTLADGSAHVMVDEEPGGLGDDAKLTWGGSGRVVDVNITGTMEVAVRVAMPDGYISIGEHFQGILNYARNAVVSPLMPYVHVTPER